MSNDSLVIKYRPRDFDEVIGQDAALRALKGALDKNRAHAFLFCGPPGTGKTTLARIIAEKLKCSPTDLLEVDAATQTGIDDMRSVTEGLSYLPLGGGIKAVIVDEAHGLSKQAWTSLLKMVEEPPAWVYWFFCTTEAGKVPKNIETRCLKVELKPVGVADLCDLLDMVVEQEKMELPKGVVDLCAKEAEGSPRKALSNLAVCAEVKDKAEAVDLLHSASDNPAAIDLARALAGRARWPEVQEILKGLKDTDPESIRHVVRGYFTSIILNAKSEEQAGKAIEGLSCFATPFNRQDGISPVILACAEYLLK